MKAPKDIMLMDILDNQQIHGLFYYIQISGI
jgi:hypothetical protein